MCSNHAGCTKKRVGPRTGFFLDPYSSILMPMHKTFKGIYKVFLIVITVCAAALSLLLVLSGNGFGAASLFIVGPFVFGVLGVLWAIYLSLDGVHESLTGANTPFKLLAYIGLASFLSGVLLLTQFAAVGGPNRGMGHFWTPGNGNPYYQMQLGLGLIALGGVVSIIVALLKRILKK